MPLTSPHPEYIERTPSPSRRLYSMLFFLLLIVCLLLVPFALTHLKKLESAPVDFPTNQQIVIAEGLTIREIVDQLGALSVIRSPLYLYIYLQHVHPDSFIHAGLYTFPEPLSLPHIAEALTSGTYQSPPVSITFPEGFSVRDLLMYLPQHYQLESVDDYLTHEGYLFPDTYFISLEATLDDIIALMKSTYEKRLEPLRPAILASGFTEEEIIILASILEREANDETSMRRVAAILKNRLAIDMPLQVDATLDYLFDKTSAELTLDDLAYDSPFNTYQYRGLPPQPIANPGIQAITIAIESQPSDELYYLTGNDGNFYYAQTFAEHVRNKERYLR